MRFEIELFQRNMDVLPSRESSVIAISYRAQDARFAAALANAFVQAYIFTMLSCLFIGAGLASHGHEEHGAASGDHAEAHH